MILNPENTDNYEWNEWMIKWDAANRVPDQPRMSDVESMNEVEWNNRASFTHTLNTFIS